MAVRIGTDMGSPATISVACRVRAAYYMPSSYGDGYRDGFSAGQTLGFQTGNAWGISNTREDAEDEGRDEGKSSGIAVGRLIGTPPFYADGYAAGLTDGRAVGFPEGMFYAHGNDLEAYDHAFTAGRDEGFRAGFSSAPGSVSDTTPPTITILSPTPGVSPGQPGGFPADRKAAVITPIVMKVGDVVPGVAYLCVTVVVDGREETVYRRGAFRGLHVEGSVAQVSGTDLILTVQRVGGWVGKFLVWDADAIDGAGNIT